jgi:hypothetical protein
VNPTWLDAATLEVDGDAGWQTDAESLAHVECFVLGVVDSVGRVNAGVH